MCLNIKIMRFCYYVPAFWTAIYEKATLTADQNKSLSISNKLQASILRISIVGKRTVKKFKKVIRMPR